MSYFSPAVHTSKIIIEHSLAITFKYISDFSNAPSWDSQTTSAKKIGDDEIGLGTVFILKGGLGGLLMFNLPYKIIEFDKPNRLIYEGKTRLFRYQDTLEFAQENGGTRLSYKAIISFNGMLSVFNPFLSMIWQGVGDVAVRGMADAVR